MFAHYRPFNISVSNFAEISHKQVGQFSECVAFQVSSVCVSLLIEVDDSVIVSFDGSWHAVAGVSFGNS